MRVQDALHQARRHFVQWCLLQEESREPQVNSNINKFTCFKEYIFIVTFNLIIFIYEAYILIKFSCQVVVIVDNTAAHAH